MRQGSAEPAPPMARVPTAEGHSAGARPAPGRCATDVSRRLDPAPETALGGHRPPVAAPGAAGMAAERTVRAQIEESWRRCAAAHVNVELQAAPLVFDADVVKDVQAGHPLDRHLPMLRGLLREVVEEAGHLMVVSDAEGHVLWAEGPPEVRRQAAGIGLVAGFHWAEPSAGTNGIGTALATGRPEYVYTAEHLVHRFRQWSSAGVPITDPDTGQVIGCLDVSATVERLHPATVALVTAVARLTEGRLALDMRLRDERLRDRYLGHLRGLRGETGALVTVTGRILAAEPAEWRDRRIAVPVPGAQLTMPDGRPAVAEPLGEVYLLRPPWPTSAAARGRTRRPPLVLSLLGADRPYARLDGRRLTLSLRHAEILALLAMHPGGLTGDQLSWHLYGDEGSPVTIRAEIHRLRTQLEDVLRAKPYRLDCAVDADFLSIRRLLSEGDLTTAARLYRGELLPRSEAPTLRAERDELTARLRGQLLTRGGPDALWTYAQTELGRDDLEILERLTALLPHDDPRRTTARSRAHRIRADYA